MLVVKVEIWPGGHPDGAKVVGMLGMANVSNLAQTSDYAVTADTDRSHEACQFVVRDHAREAGFWPLVAAAAGEAAARTDRGVLTHPHTGDLPDEYAVDAIDIRDLLALGVRMSRDQRSHYARTP